MDDIESLLSKKAELEKRKERLHGKLESARSALSDIDRELRELGVDPSCLEEEISRLLEEKERKMKTLSSALLEAENIINLIEGRLSSI